MEESTAPSELNRYRQAADVAYRYAKNKLERKDNSGPNKEQEDPFATADKERT